MIKGLEALQDLSKLVFIYGGIEQYKIIEKELKASKIIAEKEVDVHRLKTCFSEYEYNRKYEEHEYHLTQEEFYFLKEVLYGQNNM